MKLLLLVFFLGIIISPCDAQETNANNEIELRLDSIVGNHFDNHDFMGSVLIAKGEKVLLKKGYGFADIENKINNSTSTNFYIASITKIITVAAIIELKNKGMLKLDDSLIKYIPDYPNGEQITIRHLIEHKSGIVDFDNEIPYVMKKDEVQLERIIDIFKYLPLNFTPGAKRSYSNSGYVLLAYIIQKVSGENYSNYIKKNIFEKIGMENSYSNWNIIPESQANGYCKKNLKISKSEYFHPSQYLGCGNLSSSVEDLYKYYLAVYVTGTIGSEYQTGHFGQIDGWSKSCFLPIKSGEYVIIILSNYGIASIMEMQEEIYQQLDKLD